MSLKFKIKLLCVTVFFICALSFGLLQYAFLWQEDINCAKQKAMSAAISAANFATEDKAFVKPENLELAKARAGIEKIEIEYDVKDKANSFSKLEPLSGSRILAEYTAQIDGKNAKAKVVVQSFELEVLKNRFWIYALCWSFSGIVFGFIVGWLCAKLINAKIEKVGKKILGKTDDKKDSKFEISELKDLQDASMILKEINLNRRKNQSQDFFKPDFAELATSLAFDFKKIKIGNYELTISIANEKLDGGFFSKISDNKFVFGKLYKGGDTIEDISDIIGVSELFKKMISSGICAKDAFLKINEIYKIEVFNFVEIQNGIIDILNFEVDEWISESLKNQKSLILTTATMSRNLRFYSLLDAKDDKLSMIEKLLPNGAGGIFILLEEFENEK